MKVSKARVACEINDFMSDGGDSRDAVNIISKQFGITKQQAVKCYVDEFGMHPDDFDMSEI